MRRIKSILGILLILLSVLGLFLWEWKGREAIMTERVLVAKEEIRKGDGIDSSMFLIKGVSKENLLPGALMPDGLDKLQGKVAAQMISKNDQIIMKYFSEDESYLKEGQSIFVIKPGWIAMRSSSLRKGDLVDIYGSYGGEILGTYKVAYVKDEADREVRNADVEQQRTADTESILERADSTSVIDHIEVITTYSEYKKLVSYASGATESALVIVQRGDRLDT